MGCYSNSSDSRSNPLEHYDLDFDINSYAIALHQQPIGRSFSINNFLDDAAYIVTLPTSHGKTDLPQPPQG